MSQVKATAIEGDVAIGRHVTAGGNAMVRGDATVKKNLRVEGWLEARNIKGCDKGLYGSVEALEAAYPHPREGWWALVGGTLPARLYTSDGKEWKLQTEADGTPVLAGYFNVNVEDALEDINHELDGLQRSVNNIEQDLIEDINHELDGLKERLAAVKGDGLLTFEGFVMDKEAEDAGDFDEGAVVFALKQALFYRAREGRFVLAEDFHESVGDIVGLKYDTVYRCGARLYVAIKGRLAAVTSETSDLSEVVYNGHIRSDVDLFDPEAVADWAQSQETGYGVYSVRLNRFGVVCRDSEDAPAYLRWRDVGIGTVVNSYGSAYMDYTVFTGDQSSPLAKLGFLRSIREDVATLMSMANNHEERFEGLDNVVSEVGNIALGARVKAEDIGRNLKEIQSPNLYDAGESISGRHINIDTGVLSNNSTCAVSGLIPAQAGRCYTLVRSGVENPAAGMSGVRFVTAEGAPLKPLTREGEQWETYTSGGDSAVMVAPEGAAYIQFNVKWYGVKYTAVELYLDDPGRIVNIGYENLRGDVRGRIERAPDFGETHEATTASLLGMCSGNLYDASKDEGAWSGRLPVKPNTVYRLHREREGYAISMTVVRCLTPDGEVLPPLDEEGVPVFYYEDSMTLLMPPRAAYCQFKVASYSNISFIEGTEGSVTNIGRQNLNAELLQRIDHAPDFGEHCEGTTRSIMGMRSVNLHTGWQSGRLLDTGELVEDADNRVSKEIAVKGGTVYRLHREATITVSPTHNVVPVRCLTAEGEVLHPLDVEGNEIAFEDITDDLTFVTPGEAAFVQYSLTYDDNQPYSAVSLYEGEPGAITRIGREHLERELLGRIESVESLEERVSAVEEDVAAIDVAIAARWWDTTLATPTAAGWYGSLDALRLLPERLGLGRYLVTDDGQMKKLHPEDSTKYADGSPAALDGSEGQCMWCWNRPWYFTRWTEGKKDIWAVTLRPIPGRKGYRIPRGGTSWLGAGVIDRETMTLCSLISEDERYRGGNGQARPQTIAHHPAADTPQMSMLGMPATAISAKNFGIYARKRGHGWEANWFVAQAAVQILFAVIMGERNSQAAYNPETDDDGLMQGGLNQGVTGVGDWAGYNTLYPLIPTSIGVEMGDRTGLVEYPLPPSVDAEDPDTPYKIVKVPCFFGLMHAGFGHLWRIVRGILYSMRENNTAEVFVAGSMSDEYDSASTRGMIKVAEAPQETGWIKELSTEGLSMAPTQIDGSQYTYYADSFKRPAATKAGLYIRAAGGDNNRGWASGVFVVGADTVASDAFADTTSPLCYFAEDPVIEI